MNENLDLVKILKDCPRGTKLYSPLCGEVVLNSVNNYANYQIEVNHNNSKLTFTRYGRLYDEFPDGECVLFPSRYQRDWSKFKAPVKKFDYGTLKPFDKVLVRDRYDGYWRCTLFSSMLINGMLCECLWNQGLPYNDETKHLAGTTDMPDEKYIWWEK